jgi:hypothetical protein
MGAPGARKLREVPRLYQSKTLVSATNLKLNLGNLPHEDLVHAASPE